MDSDHPEPWWEASFENLETSTFGSVSFEIRLLLERAEPGGTVLDIGCGDGRIGLFLAEQGFRVTLFDVSARGIKKLKHRAATMNLTVDAFECDMRSYSFDRHFDIIIAHGSLMLVERAEWMPIVEAMKRWTAPGGFNVLAVLTDAAPTPENLRSFCQGLFHDGELKTIYLDWEQIFWESKIKVDTNLEEHRYLPLNKLIARKPQKP